LVSVALVGPDGAGKTTIAKRVAAILPLPARYLYMGDNPASANRSLFTTRLWAALKHSMGRFDETGPPAAPRSSFHGVSPVRRAALEVRAILRLLPQLGEECYRAAVGRTWERHGLVVIRDRDFFVDYYAHDIAGGAAGRTVGRSLHGSLLMALYPRPDLVICLEAPPELLLERKGEGSVEALARRAADYRAVAPQVKRFVAVDVSKSADEGVDEVSNLIVGFAGRGHRERPNR
jgi:thymidylate kinase